VTEPRQRPSQGDDDEVLHVEIHVRPRSATVSVAGTHDGALVVRVAQPAHNGQANDAAVRAVADALGVPPRWINRLRGAKARRKVLDIRVPATAIATVQRRLVQLRSGRV
jgi:uncharacterized protein YggU (UPF0235/DUF167 family)